MSFHLALIESDPILRRVFFDSRSMAPKLGRFPKRNRNFQTEWISHAGELNCLGAELAEGVVRFHKSTTLARAEKIQYGTRFGKTVSSGDGKTKVISVNVPGIRNLWLQMRDHAEGYVWSLPGDGCTHVLEFSRDHYGHDFEQDRRQRYGLWLRYQRERPPPRNAVLRRSARRKLAA